MVAGSINTVWIKDGSWVHKHITFHVLTLDCLNHFVSPSQGTRLKDALVAIFCYFCALTQEAQVCIVHMF